MPGEDRFFPRHTPHWNRSNQRGVHHRESSPYQLQHRKRCSVPPWNGTFFSFFARTLSERGESRRPGARRAVSALSIVKISSIRVNIADDTTDVLRNLTQRAGISHVGDNRCETRIGILHRFAGGVSVAAALSVPLGRRRCLFRRPSRARGTWDERRGRIALRVFRISTRATPHAANPFDRRPARRFDRAVSQVRRHAHAECALPCHRELGCPAVA
jgi:hypothetical protein